MLRGMFDMADWKEMYLTLARASEQAIRVLIDAQQRCEELYLEEEKVLLDILPSSPEGGPKF